MDAESAKKVVQVIASVLQQIVEANDDLPATSFNSRFRALKAPSISVKSYLERIARYANCSGECFVLALVYMDRLIQRSYCVITSLSVHRILITSVMLAVKFFDDHYYPNSYYAKIGGVSTNEMNLLELEFLRFVSFSLYVDPREYEEYLFQLCPRDTASDACPRDTANDISGVGSVGSPSMTASACASASSAAVSSHPDGAYRPESPRKTNLATSSGYVCRIGMTV